MRLCCVFEFSYTLEIEPNKKWYPVLVMNGRQGTLEGNRLKTMIQHAMFQETLKGETWLKFVKQEIKNTVFVKQCVKVTNTCNDTANTWDFNVE